MAVIAPADLEVGLGDVAALYAGAASTVQRLVHRWVRVPEPVVEDACQVAWSRLVARRDRVRRETAVAWVLRTAVREAIRLDRREHYETSLEALVDVAGEESLGPAPGAVEEIAAQRLRLAALAQLPARQRQLLWLQGLGLTYKEMAQATGTSRRAVERHLLRARRAVIEEGEW